MFPTVKICSLFSYDEFHPFRLPSKFRFSPVLAFTYMKRFLLQIPLQFDEAATHSSQDGYRTAPLQNRYKGLEKYCSACADVRVLPTSINVGFPAVGFAFVACTSAFWSRNIHLVTKLHDHLILVRLVIDFVMPVTSAHYTRQVAVGG